ncbi:MULTISPECIES: hypothetical protein [unclassified Frankia]|uniref:hypothetical protein n=1 Tax=unclassified Frankia TaxID=2632575 RepID=UPI002025081B
MDLAVLQAVRLKGGLADASTVIWLTGGDETAVRRALAALVTAGHVQECRGRYRIMPGGRDALRAALAVERAGLDMAALDLVWEEFSAHDHALKAILRDWQLRGEEPNDHSDTAYDAAVIARVEALHGDVGRLALRAAGVIPRLGRYPGRLEVALVRLRGGDRRFLTHPMVDSYHTVFHELHEELYGATGRDRVSEEATTG